MASPLLRYHSLYLIVLLIPRNPSKLILLSFRKDMTFCGGSFPNPLLNTASSATSNLAPLGSISTHPVSSWQKNFSPALAFFKVTHLLLLPLFLYSSMVYWYHTHGFFVNGEASELSFFGNTLPFISTSPIAMLLILDVGILLII